MALYHQEPNNFQNIPDNQLFTLYFNYEETRTHTFQPSFLYLDILHIYHQFFHKFLIRTPHVTDPEFENIPHQRSSVDQILLLLATLEDIISDIRNRFPRKHPTNHIQKDLELLPIVFCSVLDQFSLVENPDMSQLLLLYRFFHFFRTVPSIKHYNQFQIVKQFSQITSLPWFLSIKILIFNIVVTFHLSYQSLILQI